jgi:hypothetical protein
MAFATAAVLLGLGLRDDGPAPDWCDEQEKHVYVSHPCSDGPQVYWE